MSSAKKIIGQSVLKRKAAAHKRSGKKIAFTNGCFDLLHYGHVSYLEKAKKSGRILVIGLNSDRSIRTLKGKGRPIVDEKSRAALLAALECVDYVTLFHEQTPLKLISALKPDILIKGADYKNQEVVGADVVKASGGRVEFIRFVSGFSTTNMIKKVKKMRA